MNVLSLFDGISCGKVALERAGFTISNYYASEIDQVAISISKHNHPGIIQLGDVTKLDINYLKTLDIDLVIGGSPCQGFSTAGKHLNFDDPRSALLFNFIDILKELKPKYFLLENVMMKKEWIDHISTLIGVQPIQINSKLVTAALRNRLYWTNIPDVEQPEDKGILLKDILLEPGIVDRDKSYCIDANYGKGGNLKSYAKGRRQLAFLGEIGQRPYRLLTIEECEVLQTIPIGYTNSPDVASKHERYKTIGNGWTVDVIAHIFKNMEIT